MSVQENDISWQVLRRIVREWSGEAAELAEVKPLVGGCINTTLALVTADNNRAVLKISPHRVNRDLLREAHQLRLLREMGLPAPQVYIAHLADLDNPDSYLLMEFVDGIDLASAKEHCTSDQFDDLQRHLADLVRALHSRTSLVYRRENPDDPYAFNAWPSFYRHVYDAIWNDVQKSGVLPIKIRKQIGKLHENLERYIGNDDSPRLVHWDIWATNVLVLPDSQGAWRVSALLDPNCKYAHAEAELAYMELFHTITPAFLKAYQRGGHLPDAYHRVRKPIYHLYELINHVHLFGHDYLKPLLTTAERVATFV